MRVLHVIDGIGVGGAEMVLIQLLEGLQGRGVQNVVLCLTSAGVLRDRIIASGAELVEMNIASGRLPLLRLPRLVWAVRAARADVIQGWMYHGNFAATVLRAMAFLPSPMLWSIHNTLKPEPSFPAVTRLAFRMGRLLSQRPRFVIHVSRAAAEQHIEAGYCAVNTVIIANGTDCAKFRPSAVLRQQVRDELGLGSDCFVIGCLARWAEMKGHANLVQAVAALRANGKPVHLLLAGTRMEAANPELMALLAGAGLTEHCSCLGERRDAERIMASLDTLVLPSIHGEAFPMVLGEAMACEVPCLATDVGDSALLLGDAGIVVPPMDVPALTQGLERLLQMTPAARAALGAAARARVGDLFSIDSMVSAYLDLYRAAQTVPASRKMG